jgi:hypothetical protein
VDLALGSPFSIAIKGLLSLAGPHHRQIDQNVAGASVEGQGGSPTAEAGEIGEVGNAADVLGHTMKVGMPQQQPIHKSYQRCALTSCRYVPRPKIAHHRDPGQLGNHRSFTDLQSRSFWPTGVMPKGLTMAADEIDLLGGKMGRLDPLQGRCRKSSTQAKVQGADVIYRAGFGIRSPQNLRPQRWGIGDCLEMYQLPL